MINMPASPGNSPWQVAGNDNNNRRSWGDSIMIPVSPNDFADANLPEDPANGGHTQYLADMDPRNDHGKANPRNPNSKNYTNYNPTKGRQDLL